MTIDDNFSPSLSPSFINRGVAVLAVDRTLVPQLSQYTLNHDSCLHLCIPTSLPSFVLNPRSSNLASVFKLKDVQIRSIVGSTSLALWFSVLCTSDLCIYVASSQKLSIAHTIFLKELKESSQCIATPLVVTSNAGYASRTLHYF